MVVLTIAHNEGTGRNAPDRKLALFLRRRKAVAPCALLIIANHQHILPQHRTERTIKSGADDYTLLHCTACTALRCAEFCVSVYNKCNMVQRRTDDTHHVMPMAATGSARIAVHPASRCE